MGGVRLAAKIEEGLMLRFTKRVDYGDGDAVRRRPPGRGANRGHADRRRVQHPQRAPRQDPAAPGEAAPDRRPQRSEGRLPARVRTGGAHGRASGAGVGGADRDCYLYLNSTTLDYVQPGLQAGFTFVNANAKSTCGCGTSFFRVGPGRNMSSKESR